MAVDFRPLTDQERAALLEDLKTSADSDGREAVYMDPKTTTHIPRNRVATFYNRAETGDKVTDEEVVCAIRSVPCHY